MILLADAVEILPYNGPFPNALRRFDSRAAFEVLCSINLLVFTVFFFDFSYILIVEFIILLLGLLKMLKHGRKKSNLAFWIPKCIHHVELIESQQYYRHLFCVQYNLFHFDGFLSSSLGMRKQQPHISSLYFLFICLLSLFTFASRVGLETAREMYIYISMFACFFCVVVFFFFLPKNVLYL